LRSRRSESVRACESSCNDRQAHLRQNHTVTQRLVQPITHSLGLTLCRSSESDPGDELSISRIVTERTIAGIEMQVNQAG